MNAITVDQYLGKYRDHPDATSAVRRNAARWLDVVNAGLLMAEQDGVKLHVNPITGSHIAGTGNGGFRPDDCPIGAASSKHKRGKDQSGPAATDLYDPARELCAWSLKNRERLQAIGIKAIEDPRWTPSWCHWQGVAVPSGKFAFIPSNDPPLAAALPGQVVA